MYAPRGKSLYNLRTDVLSCEKATSSGAGGRKGGRGKKKDIIDIEIVDIRRIPEFEKRSVSKRKTQ